MQHSVPTITHTISPTMRMVGKTYLLVVGSTQREKEVGAMIIQGRSNRWKVVIIMDHDDNMGRLNASVHTHKQNKIRKSLSLLESSGQRHTMTVIGCHSNHGNVIPCIITLFRSVVYFWFWFFWYCSIVGHYSPSMYCVPMFLIPLNIMFITVLTRCSIIITLASLQLTD